MSQTSASTPSGPQLATQSDNGVLEKVRTLLAPFNHKAIEITRATAIISDLEIDSVAVFDLIMEVEDAYEITFPMETVSEMKTVGELVDTIKALQTA